MAALERVKRKNSMKTIVVAQATTGCYYGLLGRKGGCSHSFVSYSQAKVLMK
jgi:hypothetical protein